MLSAYYVGILRMQIKLISLARKLGLPMNIISLPTIASVSYIDTFDVFISTNIAGDWHVKCGSFCPQDYDLYDQSWGAINNGESFFTYSELVADNYSVCTGTSIYDASALNNRDDALLSFVYLLKNMQKVVNASDCIEDDSDIPYAIKKLYGPDAAQFDLFRLNNHSEISAACMMEAFKDMFFRDVPEISSYPSDHFFQRLSYELLRDICLAPQKDRFFNDRRDISYEIYSFTHPFGARAVRYVQQKAHREEIEEEFLHIYQNLKNDAFVPSGIDWFSTSIWEEGDALSLSVMFLYEDEMLLDILVMPVLAFISVITIIAEQRKEEWKQEHEKIA